MSGVLQEPLKIALGGEATTQIFTLTNSTAKMLEKLQHLTMVYKTGQTQAKVQDNIHIVKLCMDTSGRVECIFLNYIYLHLFTYIMCIHVAYV